MSRSGLQEAIGALLQGLKKRDVRGKLWIVARGKIREYWAEDDD
jgi:hypothetical protein